jgi:hypothetical protein
VDHGDVVSSRVGASRMPQNDSHESTTCAALSQDSSAPLIEAL